MPSPVTLALPALRALFPLRKKFLVAVSGGADSMALLYLLVESGAKSLVVCHLNHGLRGRAADQDEAFVKKHCALLGLKCLTQSADIRAEAEASGESIETAARHRRHRFFAECAQQERCPRVVLAHHAAFATVITNTVAIFVYKISGHLGLVHLHHLPLAHHLAFSAIVTNTVAVFVYKVAALVDTRSDPVHHQRMGHVGLGVGYGREADSKEGCQGD